MLRLDVLSPHDMQRSCLGKTQYASKNAARDASRRIAKREGQTLYVYHCKACTDYHLTHHDPLSQAGIKETLRNRINGESS